MVQTESNDFAVILVLNAATQATAAHYVLAFSPQFESARLISPATIADLISPLPSACQSRWLYQIRTIPQSQDLPFLKAGTSRKWLYVYSRGSIGNTGAGASSTSKNRSFVKHRLHYQMALDGVLTGRCEHQCNRGADRGRTVGDLTRCLTHFIMFRDGAKMHITSLQDLT